MQLLPSKSSLFLYPLNLKLAIELVLANGTLENMTQRLKSIFSTTLGFALSLLGNLPLPREQAQASFLLEEGQRREKPQPPSHLSHLSYAN